MIPLSKVGMYSTESFSVVAHCNADHQTRLF